MPLLNLSDFLIIQLLT